MRIITQLLALLMLTGTSLVFGQDEKKAKSILDQLSEKFTNTSAFRAKFTFKIMSSGQLEDTPYDGEVVVKGEDFRISMDDASETEFFKSGETLWLKRSNVVNISNYDPSQIGYMNISNIFDLYKKGVNLEYIGDGSLNGRPIHRVKLIAKQDNEYFKDIVMVIDRERNELMNCLISDRYGTEYEIELSGFETGITVSDSYFVFNEAEYPGVQVDDARF